MASVPTVRRPRFAFGPEVGRHWFGGSAVRTHLANGLNFVFPEGERFFIRSVRQYADRVTDPELRERVAAFAGQEAQHQRAHLASFAALEAQGYELASWMTWYEHVAYEQIEPRIPPVLRLATTAALEHFTATFGELALRTEMLDDAHPAMRALLRWHAAEEIEHRDVAFDVLLVVDPRWRVRAGGFVVATGVLGFFWASGYRHLMRQERARAAEGRVAEGVDAEGVGAEGVGAEARAGSSPPRGAGADLPAPGGPSRAGTGVEATAAAPSTAPPPRTDAPARGPTLGANPTVGAHSTRGANPTLGAHSTLGAHPNGGAHPTRDAHPTRGAHPDREGARRVRQFWAKHGPGFARSVLAYLKPGFHPRDAGSDALAEGFFAEMGAV